MSVPDRVADALTTYGKSVIVVMLLISVILGMGITHMEQSPGLDQFEFETAEGDALDYIADHFDVDENRTTVQIVLHDQDNALSRDSFLETLDLQQDLRDDPDVNATLTDEPFEDLAGIVATQAILADELDELEAEEQVLENESEELNESLEDLEDDAAELETRRDQLEADQAALENRTDILREALETTAAIQVDAETGERSEADAEAAMADTWTRAQAEAALDAEQNATFEVVAQDVREVAALEFEREAAIEAGPADITPEPDEQAILRGALNETIELQSAYDAAETDEERAEIDAAIEDTWMGAVENATLSPEQEDAFRNLGNDVRELSSAINEVGPMPRLFEAGTIGVFNEELSDLEQRGEELETDAEEIEDRGDELEERADVLEQRGEELQEAFEATMERDPTLAEQREQLEEMEDDEVEELVGELLDEDADRQLFSFVPTDFDPGDTEADARQLFVSQETDDEEIVEGAAPDYIVASQLAIDDHVSERFDGDGFTFGVGIITDEIDRSMADSLAIVLPLAFLFVIVVLTIAYRDPLDILLGLTGIGLVLVWTFGFMGWAGITFNQIMIAVPVLLVGLSIDYAIHVFMRHRERRAEADREPRRAMYIVLLGLGAALVWVTITAVIGFLSNLVSPVSPIRDFGLASAFGIFATLLIFGVFVPASKLVLDVALESYGLDRRKRAFGTSGGRLTQLLQVGNLLAQRLPIGVVFLVLLLTAGGVFGATQVDTEFNQEDFIADDPPDWMGELPAAFAPGEYTVKTNLDFVNERFIRQDTATQVLVTGNVATADTLERIDQAERLATEDPHVITLSDGEPDVQSSLTSMRSVAEENETFAEIFDAADTTGDDVPNENVSGVYDAYFEAAPDEAPRFLAQSDGGEYIGTRMTVSIEGDASAREATDTTRELAAVMAGNDRESIATGQLVVFNVIEGGLFDAVIESLLVTFVAVFAFLMGAYRTVYGSAILGAVTLAPILLAVAWILGTMYLLEIPFNVMTGTITSLTIGLGVAYNIHISERYRLEASNGLKPAAAMERAVTGTGGALLGSAATTIGGFGVLVFAILPPLQQFGLITALTIFYAFLGSVFVLPSFLMLWTRYIDS